MQNDRLTGPGGRSHLNSAPPSHHNLLTLRPQACKLGTPFPVGARARRLISPRLRQHGAKLGAALAVEREGGIVPQLLLHEPQPLSPGAFAGHVLLQFLTDGRNRPT
jgi:hypothetical protein